MSSGEAACQGPDRAGLHPRLPADPGCRVLRSFPDNWSAHAVIADGSTLHVGASDWKPAYENLDQALRRARARKETAEFFQRGKELAESGGRRASKGAAGSARLLVSALPPPLCWTPQTHTHTLVLQLTPSYAGASADLAPSFSIGDEEIDAMDAKTMRTYLSALGGSSAGGESDLRHRLKQLVRDKALDREITRQLDQA